jgi:membrane-bound serine protease (ClpP class)
LEELVGEEGVAVTDIAPEGQVRARRETWSSAAAGPAIQAGARVRILRVEGLRLIVEPVGEEGAPIGPSLAARKGGRT